MHRGMFALVVAVGCKPMATTWPDEKRFDTIDAEVQSDAPLDPPTVRVQTWNLKYGWGRNDIFFDGWGDLVELPEEEIHRALDAEIALVLEAGSDVLMVQEIDKRARRSAWVDEVRYVLDHTPFNHAAYIPMWKTEYAAQSGLGPVEMGMAVFSRWPIVDNLRIKQPVSRSDPGYVRYFSPLRAIQRVEIDLGGAEVLTIVNVHPTAYSLDGTKLAHLAQIHEVAAAVPGPLVVGGDFNVIPPGSVNPDTFDDVVATETAGVTEVVYTPEEMDALLPFYDDWEPAIALDAYQHPTGDLDPGYDQAYTASTCAGRPDDQRRYFSHSLSSQVFWNQKLDYLFTDLAWSSGTVLQCPGDGSPAITSEPMTLSDHAPVVADLVLP